MSLLGVPWVHWLRTLVPLCGATYKKFVPIITDNLFKISFFSKSDSDLKKQDRSFIFIVLSTKTPMDKQCNKELQNIFSKWVFPKNIILSKEKRSSSLFADFKIIKFNDCCIYFLCIICNVVITLTYFLFRN